MASPGPDRGIAPIFGGPSAERVDIRAAALHVERGAVSEARAGFDALAARAVAERRTTCGPG
jgi:hypothetical protein